MNATPGIGQGAGSSSGGSVPHRTAMSTIPALLAQQQNAEHDLQVAFQFYSTGQPFYNAKDPEYKAAYRGPGNRLYNPPTYEKLRTTLLDAAASKIEERLQPLMKKWNLYGCSIISDAWTNVKKHTLMNFLAQSGGYGAMYLKAVDTEGNVKDAEYIAEEIDKCIMKVGINNVVQIITDSASNCKKAGRIIEEKYPQLFWSPCVAHCLSLLLKDIS